MSSPELDEEQVTTQQIDPEVQRALLELLDRAEEIVDIDLS